MFTDSSWLLALDLHERVALLRKRRDVAAPPDEALAARRLARWRSLPVFAGDAVWREFLATWGVTEEELVRVLGEGPEVLAARSGASPEWLTRLKDLYSSPPVDRPLALTGYLRVIGPLIDVHYEQLCRHAADETLARLLLEPILQRLRRMIMKTMILETNIARLRGELPGDDPEARYQAFVVGLDDPRRSWQILSEYPVLARQCLETCGNWLDAGREFIGRLRADHARLAAFFDAPGLGPVVKIEGNLGDAHKRGRCVLMAEFQSGKRLVYKPRPLAADAAVQEFLAWLNPRGPQPQLKTHKIFDLGTHGWAEWVPFKTCTSEAELERFYARHGAWLAVIYALGITDLHLENIIASGEDPVVIDLETIFHPRVTRPPLGTADEVAAELMGNSVLSAGLLPTPQRFDGNVLDKSGIGARANQRLPVDVDSYEGLGTDEVRVEKVPGAIGEVRNRPLLNGRPVEFLAFQRWIVEGFAGTYRVLLAKRYELLSPTGPLARFRNLPIRAVLRATSTYSGYLSEAIHPRLCRNALDRDLLYAQIWDMARLIPAYARLCPAERRQLMGGDIPYFLTEPGSHDLLAGDGSRIPAVFEESGWDLTRERISRMGEGDLELQLRLIDGSLVSAATESRDIVSRPVAHGAATFLEGARAVAERLIATAVRTAGTVSWIALRFRRDDGLAERGFYKTGVIDLDLYSGIAGVALFFVYLSRVTGEPRYQEFLEEIMRTIERRLEQARPPHALGAFSGFGGLVYLFTHSGALDRACALTEALLPDLSADPHFDVIAGVAGCIPVFLGLNAVKPGAVPRGAAVACGERLLRLAQDDYAGLQAQRGLSHGLAGVAWSLVSLGAALGEERFTAGGLAALARERELLTGGVWTDIPENPRQSTWCHGAHGIALARLDMARRHPTAGLRQDALAALSVALAAPALRNQIICHGSVGNLETWQQAAATFPEDARWRHELDLQAKDVLRSIHEEGWISPLPAQVMEPGLMKGLAGIGYGLLRLAFPAQVPPALLLAPPIPG